MLTTTVRTIDSHTLAVAVRNPNPQDAVATMAADEPDAGLRTRVGVKGGRVRHGTVPSQ
jgi:hypothetical protein